MKALILAEIYKLLKQGKTYYAIAAIFLIEIIILISAYYQGNSILDVLLDNLKQSFYFEGELLNGNLLIYLILNTLWFHLPLILMIIISGMLTSEYKDNTLLTNMLQPISKWKFILSKYIVAILFTVLIVFFLALTSFILSYGLFGKGDLVVYLNSLNFFDTNDAYSRILDAFLAGTISMVFYSVVSLTLAIVLEEATKTWIVSAFFLVVTNLILKMEFNLNCLDKWFYAKLTDTWQYFFYAEIPWKTILWNNSILMLYTLICITLGIFIFNKKDIG